MTETDPDFERVDALLREDDLAGLEALLADDASFGRVKGPRGESVICHAFYLGRGAAARRLAEAKQDVDVFEMVALGLVDGVGGLIQISPQVPNALTPDGFTLVQLACYLSRPEVVELLLEQGADPEARSTNGAELRALHAAVAGGDPACVRLVLARDVEVDSRQRGGFTALHGAANRGSAELVGLLLAAGADPSIEADDGRRPADLAGEFPEVLGLLGDSGETSRADDAPARFEDEQLVLVDGDDRPVGRASKGACHLGAGRTHRAFSAVVTDGGGRVLLARRAASKPLWPGFWDATVASHPREGEGQEAAAARRLVEELGVALSPRLGDRFQYRIPYGDVGVEDEVCAVLVVEAPDGTEFRPAPDEIDAVEWVTRGELARRLTAGGEDLCPWLPLTLLGLESTGLFADPAGVALLLAARAWADRAPFDGPWRLLRERE